MANFTIEVQRYGGPWKDYDVADTYEDALEILRDAEDHEGRYSYRMLEGSGRVVIHEKRCAYENVKVDPVGDPNWLRDLLTDYGLTDKEVIQGIANWLQDYNESL